jgi:Tfp pilus assembly protein PilF
MNTQVPVPASETQYERALQAMRDGDKDAALRNLSAALAGGFSDWQRIDAETLFAVLASDVRFQVLRSRWKKG